MGYRQELLSASALYVRVRPQLQKQTRYVDVEYAKADINKAVAELAQPRNDR